MRRWVVGWVLLNGGCLDMNPMFVDPTTGDEAGATTSAPPATDSATTSESPDTALTSTTGMTSETSGTSWQTSGPDTMGTLEPATEGSSTTMPIPETKCGDGNLDPDEQCDDGNDNPNDDCTDTCTVPYCGDGVVYYGEEECDDGSNGVPTDGCFDNCTLPVCGDNIWDDTEECEDANNNDDDGCEHNCRKTRKIIFVSSLLLHGDMGGLLGADNVCNTLAKNVKPEPLPGTYMAWLSTDEETPSSRMTYSKYPYVRSDGSPIADNWAALVTGQTFSPIDLDETGAKHLGAPPMPEGCGWSAVYTNTLPSGERYGFGKDCNGWTGLFGDTLAGSLAKGEFGWTDYCKIMKCNTMAPIYCVQQ